VVDPRRERIADHADIFCQIKPGTDVAFYNGVLHEIIQLGLVDREFVAERTTNYGALAKTVKEYTPERAGQICGIEPT
jgi:formate dehydrogenase major subunit